MAKIVNNFQEEWNITNNTNNIIMISVKKAQIPGIIPGGTLNLLRYATKDNISQSVSLMSLINNGNLTLIKSEENVTVDEILSVEQNELDNSVKGNFGILVVSSEASNSDKEKADYICTGASDDIQINNAIEEVYSSGVGGAVYLSTGVFNISNSVLLKRGVSVLGAQTGAGSIGYFGTVIAVAAGSNCNAIEYRVDTADWGPSFIKLSDFTVDGNKSTNPTAGYGIYMYSPLPEEYPMDVLFDRVWCWDCREDGFHIIGDGIYHDVEEIDGTNPYRFIVDGDITGWQFGANLDLYLKGAAANTNEGYGPTGKLGKYDITGVDYDGINAGKTTITVSQVLVSETTAGMQIKPRNRQRAWGIMFRNCLSETNFGHGLYADLSQGYITGFYSAYNDLDQFHIEKSQRIVMTQLQTLDRANLGRHAFYCFDSVNINITNSTFASAFTNAGTTKHGIIYDNVFGGIINANCVITTSGDIATGIRIDSCFDLAVDGNQVEGCDLGLEIRTWSGWIKAVTVAAVGNNLEDNTVATRGRCFGSPKLLDADEPQAATADTGTQLNVVEDLADL